MLSKLSTETTPFPLFVWFLGGITLKIKKGEEIMKPIFQVGRIGAGSARTFATTATIFLNLLKLMVTIT